MSESAALTETMMWLKGLTVLLTAVGLLAMGVACGGDFSGSPHETKNPEGVTWVLQAMYGEPLLDGTFVWLRMDGDDHGGVDGCNQYGGANRNGRPVVGDDGKFDPQSMSWTNMDCPHLDGVMEQAEEYRRLLGSKGRASG